MWSTIFRFDRHEVMIITADSTVSKKHIIWNISETVKSLSSPQVKIHVMFMKLKSETQIGRFEIEQYSTSQWKDILFWYMFSNFGRSILKVCFDNWIIVFLKKKTF